MEDQFINISFWVADYGLITNPNTSTRTLQLKQIRNPQLSGVLPPHVFFIRQERYKIMQEYVYYSDNSTKITDEWARLGGKSFRLSDIQSVEVCSTQTDSSRNLPSFLVVAGSLLMFGVSNLQNFFPIGWDGLVPTTHLLGILIALAGITILIIQMLLKSDYIYMVSMRGTFGNACPFASDDELYVRKVAAAIQTALIARRADAPAPHSSLVDMHPR